MKRWLAIANPAAGRGRVRRQRQRCLDALDRADVDFDCVDSERPGHAIELAEVAARAGRRRFIAIGGDGTLNEVVNGAARAAPIEELTIALLPVGRGNDWARSWRLGSDIRQAARVIAAEHSIKQDVGVARFSSGQRWFVNVAGVGFDAAVVSATRRLSLGALTYFVGLLAALATYRPTPLPISILAADGSLLRLDGASLATFICLTPLCGGGMRVAPAANPLDGLFDVTRIGAVGRLSLLANVRRLFDGTILAHPGVTGFRATAVEVHAQGIPVEADGELIGTSPVTFELCPAALNLVVPHGTV